MYYDEQKYEEYYHKFWGYKQQDQNMYTEKTYKKTWTCQEVYGKQFHELKAPQGWEFTGEFRPPDQDDFFLSAVRHADVMGPLTWNTQPDDPPRLILRKQEVTDYYLKYDGVRPVDYGEYYQSVLILPEGERLCRWPDKAPSSNEYHVWKKFPVDPLTNRPDFDIMTDK
jgi:hypothetical protein